MERLMMLATIYGGIRAIEKILELELAIYERQRLEDALFYLEGLYDDRKKKS
jgi:hypothetical protein